MIEDTTRKGRVSEDVKDLEQLGELSPLCPFSHALPSPERFSFATRFANLSQTWNANFSKLREMGVKASYF